MCECGHIEHKSFAPSFSQPAKIRYSPNKTTGSVVSSIGATLRAADSRPLTERSDLRSLKCHLPIHYAGLTPRLATARDPPQVI